MTENTTSAASSASSLSLVAIGCCILAVSSTADHPWWKYPLNALAILLFLFVIIRDLRKPKGPRI
ncbi:MAG: hypothetical protein MUF10_13860 [Thermoanaerobaculaceae bacterium]|jgi:hypothetical protein|nr:hypothetical protein [Thermoanaerobaculaceae bacterium]